MNFKDSRCISNAMLANKIKRVEQALALTDAIALESIGFIYIT